MSLTVEKCLQAWTNSLKQLRVEADVVFFGDSLTYYGDFASVYPDKVVCNLGLRVDTLQGMIDRVDQVRLLKPGTVFLMAGINDVNIPTESFDFLYNLLVDSFLRVSPNARLIAQSILPVNTQDFSVSCDNDRIKLCNKIVHKIAISKSLKYLDLYTCYEQDGQLPSSYTKDGIHLFPEAYKIWYDMIDKVF